MMHGFLWDTCSCLTDSTLDGAADKLHKFPSSATNEEVLKKANLSGARPSCCRAYNEVSPPCCSAGGYLS